ncbi:aspartyl aminopeptidase [Laetiporus sulphureus 93-53]|uniref:aspartyl aminopeptidase n=1 Tax=Laetiporus sulphureus 93-53 TaxID=1314785 RepID=A0A165IA85_9APHY|nr:aspartyl aminopeptidase [Laetiporus sulphureus 93-53]KZT12797.1 aspartyl aminopeptidase [Laetiporus sulphureus 93-53]
MMLQSGTEAASRLLNFVNASPTPFHAVQAAALRLEKAGFRKVKERDEWEKELADGGKYYMTRNQSSLVAWTIPENWKAGAGVSIVATHVDSPNLRVRPVSKRSSVGYLQVGVETYGGGLWHTWFDRDLSLAGRVILQEKNGGFTSKLVKIERPILRVPNLAIHLERNISEGFKFNQETNMIPIAGIIESQLNSSTEPTSSVASNIQANHHAALLEVLSQELSAAPEDIYDFELHLHDTQPSVLGGLKSEFIFSPRMDNQFSSFCALDALASFATSQSFSTAEGNVNCIALFNHEEIGSVSTTGAESSLILTLLNRLSPSPSTLAQSIARSFLISSDMTHAVHPNYLGKYEDNHRPMINGGVTIKTNAKQRYATDAIGTFLVKKLIEKKGGKVQNYEVRNDMACGSTVGPGLSKLGIRTVDVGCPMLSMHSIRETAGADDVQSAIDLFTAFFESFAELDQDLLVD